MGKPSFTGEWGADALGGRTVTETAQWFSDERFEIKLARAQVKLQAELRSPAFASWLQIFRCEQHRRFLKRREIERKELEELRNQYPWEWLSEIYRQYKRR